MAVPLQVQQSSREAIVEQLSRQYRMQLVNRLSRVLGQRAIAEEVAQDTFERLLCWEPLERTSPADRKAVLFRAAHRLAIDRIRRARTIARGGITLAADQPDEPFEPLAQPEQTLLAQQAIARLTQIVDALPERLREPWILRYVEELPHAEICTRLNITETTLEQRIREARAWCRAEMARSGFERLGVD